MTTKTAVVRSHEQLYRGKVGVPEMVDVPPARFVMLDGHGDPNTASEYPLVIQSLYSVAYGIKFALKKAGGPNERVAPLEGLWWGAEATNFASESKDTWDWTMMIRLPEAATDELVDGVLLDTARKKPDLPIDRLRVERFAEGRAAQVMYLGPYSDEGPTIQALHEFIAEQGYQRSGKHHEIYLGDPRRSAPERLKTLIRQTVK